MLGENLRRLRDARGWSQEALAKRAGLTQSRVRAIETGETASPRVDTLAKLAAALEVAPEALTGASGGMAEQAQPFAHAPRDLVFRLSPRAGHPVAFRITGDMPSFGLLDGDAAVVDLKGAAAAGDIVIATIADAATGAARTMVLRYLPPALVGHDARSVTPCDSNTVAIMGPVVAVFRSRDAGDAPPGV